MSKSNKSLELSDRVGVNHALVYLVIAVMITVIIVAVAIAVNPQNTIDEQQETIDATLEEYNALRN